MYISQFEICNFKSFFRSNALQLKPGFNIITGQNNAGKSAFLDALNLRFAFDPHRSLRTMPNVGVRPEPVSSVDISFVLSRDELLQILAIPRAEYYIAAPVIGAAPGYANESVASQQAFIDWLLSRDNYTFRLRLEKQANQEQWAVPQFPSLGLYQAREQYAHGYRHFIRIRFDGQRFVPVGDGIVGTNENAEFGVVIASSMVGRIYRFTAERFNMAVRPFGPSTVLNADASNLPEVLNALQGHNPRRFAELNRLLNEVFPQIYEVSVRPTPANQLEIIVWTTDPALQRDDLSISLQQSGTGIGQVLAVLYVVLTSNFPQAILIDEPQSFLHPGATRKLIEILRRFPQHQFVVATHSPTIITAANPATITMLKLDCGQTTLQGIDPGSTKDLQVFLAEVGVRFSDVFGADNVVWVEGRTEELCFPKILNGIAGRSLMGTAIVGLTRTGDLEGRNAERALELYNQLSRANSLAPPTLMFILDSECRTEQEKRELVTRSNDRLRFLPRRMYENYLLHSAAIASTVNAIQDFRAQPVTEDEIEALIAARLPEGTYYCPQRLGGPQQRGRNWLDAARVLGEIFVRLSENRFEYEKVKHGMALTEWLVENAPQQLGELADLLEDVLVRREPG